MTEVQSEMVAPAESKRQPEPQTSSIEVTDAAPGSGTTLDVLTSKAFTQIRELTACMLHGTAWSDNITALVDSVDKIFDYCRVSHPFMRRGFSEKFYGGPPALWAATASS